MGNYDMITDWDDAYTVGDYIPGAEAFREGLPVKAAAYRQKLDEAGRSQENISYGDASREKLDIFLPEQPAKGLCVFVHGGYWKAFDKSSWSHYAEGMNAAGWAVAMPSYTLAPDAGLPKITGQVGQAIEVAAARIDGPIVLAGHSAGGHLVSRMACDNSPLSDATRDRLAGVLSISGLHDLRPFLKTSMNKILGLDEATAMAESPALLRPMPGICHHAHVGAIERPEFLRQNALIANIWTGLGANCSLSESADRDHFSVLDGLLPQHGELVAIAEGFV